MHTGIEGEIDGEGAARGFWTDARAQQLLDLLGVRVWAFDASTGRAVFASRALRGLLGARVGAVPSVEEHVRHDDRDALRTGCREVARAGEPRGIELRVVASSGRPISLAGELRPLGDHVAAVLVESARRSDAIAASEGLYRDVYEKTPVRMHATDRDGRLVAVSDAWLDVLGYSRDEVLGRDALEFLTPESRRYTVDVAMPELLRTGAARDLPNQFRKKSGEVIDVQFSTIVERDAEGDVMRALSVYADVTEQRRAEAERDRLLVTERAARADAEHALTLLDSVLTSAPLGLALLDRDLRYVRVNENLATVHEIGPENAAGRSVWEATPRLAPELAKIMRQVLETGEPFIEPDVAGESRAFPGEPRTFVVSYFPVRAPGGEIVGVGVASVDVTEQRRAAAIQARLYREAQEAIRVRDDFMSIASHELRTPLTPLALYIDIVERKVRARDPIEIALVQSAKRQIAKLTDLIGDLLDSSRVQAGRLVLHRARIPFRAVVEVATENARALGPRSTITLTEPVDDLVVLGDAGRLSQVVTNLLENAVKYSSGGGAIQVTLERQGHAAHLAVVDHGIGIPHAQLSHLFDRFFRASNAPISQYGGLGLGLYISRDIVERHGGRIWAESELDSGTTLHVTIPLAPDAPDEW